MVNRPSVPEIITVNSETLQTQIRDLLPSQNGFGSELQASNVITPIIDLTSAAEGSTVSESLQQAFSFGSQTAHSVNNTTSTIISLTGFYRLFGAFSFNDNATITANIQLNDGSTDKTILGFSSYGSGGTSQNQILFPVDIIIFLAAGESVKVTCTGAANSLFIGTSRQIATGDGTLVNPNGFPL